MAKLYAGLDVSDKSTSICVIDGRGSTVLETATSTSHAAIAEALKPVRKSLALVGLESGSRGIGLYRRLRKARFPIVCMDAYHAHSALNARLNKTDANDARGLAVLLSKQMYRDAFIKSEEAYRIRVVITLRDLIQHKKQSLSRALLNARTLTGVKPRKIGTRGPKPYLSESQKSIEAALKCCADSVEALQRQFDLLDRAVRIIAKEDDVCRRLMTVPGVGPITALTFVSAIDDPYRFKASRMVGAYFGLTPRVYQSGQSVRSGGISHRGDVIVRTALVGAARSLLLKSRSNCGLRRWGLKMARTKGFMTAYVAVARKLAVLMHHLWVTGDAFDPSK